HQGLHVWYEDPGDAARRRGGPPGAARTRRAISVVRRGGLNQGATRLRPRCPKRVKPLAPRLPTGKVNGMFWKASVVALILFPMTIRSQAQGSTAAALQNFETRAAKWNAVIRLPHFETDTNAVRDSVKQTITAGNKALDAIAAIDPAKTTFKNSVRALDDVGYDISLTDNRLQVIKETSPNAALRETATDSLKELEEWMVGLEYREDVYRVIKAFAERKPKLKDEDAKLLLETMRDFRRAGLELPKPERDEV